jgi:hypothetical protein
MKNFLILYSGQKYVTGNLGIHSTLNNGGELRNINDDPSLMDVSSSSGAVIRRNACVTNHPTGFGS